MRSLVSLFIVLAGWFISLECAAGSPGMSVSSNFFDELIDLKISSVIDDFDFLSQSNERYLSTAGDLAYDDFCTDSTEWTAVGGTWELLTDACKYQLTTTGGGFSVISDTKNFTDYKISWRMHLNDSCTRNAGLLFRGENALEKDALLSIEVFPSSGSIKITKKDDAWSTLSSVGLGHTPSSIWVTGTLVAKGSTYNATVLDETTNTTHSLWATDSAYASGYIGFHTWNCPATFDYIEVTSLSLDDPPTLSPTQTPSTLPTGDPTRTRTLEPSLTPTQISSQGTTQTPSLVPTLTPSQAQSELTNTTSTPSDTPTTMPTAPTTAAPTTAVPTAAPTTAVPTESPTAAQTQTTTLFFKSNTIQTDDAEYSYLFSYLMDNETEAPTIGATAAEYEVSFSLSLTLDGGNASLLNSNLDSLRNELADTLSVSSSQITITISDTRRDLSAQNGASLLFYEFLVRRGLLTTVVLDVVVSEVSYSSSESIESILEADDIETVLQEVFTSVGISTSSISVSSVTVMAVAAATVQPSTASVVPTTATTVLTDPTVTATAPVTDAPTESPTVAATRGPIILETTVCASGYNYEQGSNPGWGKTTWRGIAYSCEGCASVCDSQEDCVAYECSENYEFITCNLHTREPTHTSCVKVEDYEDPTTDSLYTSTSIETDTDSPARRETAQISFLFMVCVCVHVFTFI